MKMNLISLCLKEFLQNNSLKRMISRLSLSSNIKKRNKISPQVFFQVEIVKLLKVQQHDYEER